MNAALLTGRSTQSHIVQRMAYLPASKYVRYSRLDGKKHKQNRVKDCITFKNNKTHNLAIVLN